MRDNIVFRSWAGLCGSFLLYEPAATAISKGPGQVLCAERWARAQAKKMSVLGYLLVAIGLLLLGKSWHRMRRLCDVYNEKLISWGVWSGALMAYGAVMLAKDSL